MESLGIELLHPVCTNEFSGVAIFLLCFFPVITAAVVAVELSTPSAGSALGVDEPIASVRLFD
jgi:hypothetical protein